MNKAVFSLENFVFNKVNINFDNLTNDDLKINFVPEGAYDIESGIFHLSFKFTATNESQTEEPFIFIQCIGDFKFEDKPTLEELPTYFYRNSIAILFPYIRAFITNVTTQANLKPLILPTMNLSSLEEPLKQNTKVK